MRTRSRVGFVATAAVVLLTIAAPSARAQQFELINSFAGCPSEGCGTTGDAAHPYAGDPWIANGVIGELLVGPDGYLYGISRPDFREGEVIPRSWGTIFRAGPDGSRIVLHHFSGQEPGGCGPGGIGFSAAGVLYAAGRRCTATGSGTIFRLVDGVAETVQEFPTPGFHPYTLVASTAGTFYVFGADHSATSGQTNFRNYRWDETNGTLTPLSTSAARMVPAPDGHVYAALALHHPFFVAGWIDRIDDGARFHVFEVDEAPDPELVMGADGNLYGSAAHYVNGFVTRRRLFKMSPAGSLTYVSDQPLIPLGSSADGWIYGRVAGPGDGQLARFRPGTFTTIHTFDGSDGSGAFSPLVRGTDGHLYGLRNDGGEHGLGTLYRIRLPTVDVDANGADGPIEIAAGTPLQISIAFDASVTEVVTPSEVYVAVVTPGLEIVWATPSGFSLTPSPIYTGPLPSFASTPLIDIPDAAVLQPGDYYWIAVVDADSNGVPNGHYVDFVKTTKGPG